ncbi:MAG: RNA pseudouridine synthase [Bdellovibrionota bacterium]
MNQIQILLQNPDYIVVNKDAGISVHNNEDPQNLLLLLEKQLKVGKLFPVHRLDKETSGIQVLALNSEAARTVAEEFQKKTVKKIYAGILRGQLKTAQGSWNKPLTDKAEGRKNPEGSAKDRVPCDTRFKVIKGNSYFSFCEFDLITGRQHQIRKHAAVVNHPIVGDPRYGDPKYNQKMADIYKTERMFLHCSRIELLGQIIECPPPKIFEEIL